jgi:hypothetical protein
MFPIVSPMPLDRSDSKHLRAEHRSSALGSAACPTTCATGPPACCVTRAIPPIWLTKLDWIIEHPAARRQYGAVRPPLVRERFSMDVVTRSYIALYERLTTR